MATASSSMAVQSANSCYIPSSSFKTNDVFLSFRGEDTRLGFVSHLYKELVQKGLNVFKDDEELERGKQISPELLSAIRESRISVVVLSKNYAESRWCLEELVEILECVNRNSSSGMEAIVLPVFYHVAPSEVRRQTGKFGRGFDRLLSEHELPPEKVVRFKEALEKVGNLSGWELVKDRKDRSESEFIEDLVGYIFEKSDHLYSGVAKDLVGMDSRMNEVLELLALGNDDIRAIGIYGMGGIGKTTIARAVYDFISWQFPSRSFIGNVRAISEENGVRLLQEQLIRDILMPKDLKGGDIGESMIRNRVCRKRVLIVFDDVDELTVLEKLVALPDLVCSGSRIIVTSRDKHLLDTYGATHAYKVEELDTDEAVELFQLKAFGKQQLMGVNEELLNRAVGYCKGLPLALRVLGSALTGRNEDQWRSALNRLEESPLSEVMASCLFSYDQLTWTEKQIFLDIACCFQGSDKNIVTEILKSCGFEPEIGIQVLVDKSLVTVSHYNVLWMHDLIQDVGRRIVFEESPKRPGYRSRLFRYEDVYQVLMENMGTDTVESIVLESSWLFPGEKCLQLRADIFAKMKNLRLLKIRDNKLRLLKTRGVHLPKGLDYPSSELYLDWQGCRLIRFPRNFQPEHLDEFSTQWFSIRQLLEGTMALPDLRIAEVGCSGGLIKSLGIAEFPNLEQLYLQCCSSFVEAHPSFGDLKKLTRLDFRYCENLTSLPDSMELKTLDGSGCVSAKLANIPETMENIKCLLEVHLDRTDITELSDSVENPNNLFSLSLDRCRNLNCPPDSLCQAKAFRSLVVTGCSKFSQVQYLDYFLSLDPSFKLIELIERDQCFQGFEKLFNSWNSPLSFFLFPGMRYNFLSGNDFESFPSSMNQLSNLWQLKLGDCKRLQELPELTPGVGATKATECESLQRISGENELDAFIVNQFQIQKMKKTVTNLQGKPPTK